MLVPFLRESGENIDAYVGLEVAMKRLGLFGVSIGLAVLGIAGCATPYQPQQIFNMFEFFPYQTKGTATIRGSAFLKTRGGEVRLGAGNEVELVPLVPYIEERLQVGTIRGVPLPPRDSRVDAFSRKTIADAQGNFEFTGLPAGRYVLYCAIVWEVPFGSYTTQQTGGTAYAVVTVKEGETAKVIVTR